MTTKDLNAEMRTIKAETAAKLEELRAAKKMARIAKAQAETQHAFEMLEKAKARYEAAVENQTGVEAVNDTEND